MNRNKLNGFSRRFANFLFAKQPEWEAVARIDEKSPPDNQALVVKLTPPNPNAEAPLEIFTYDQEITVAFANYHTHFESYDRKHEQEEFQAALDFVLAIISDDICTTAWKRNGKWLGSSCIQGNGRPDSRFLTQLPDKFIQRSWSGNRDIVEEYET